MKIFKKGKVPLQRALSKLGIASRTEARKLILEGKIVVNGVRRTDPGFFVNPERMQIKINEEQVSKPAFRCLLLHKPKGVVTTKRDEKNRPTVFSLIDDPVHLIAVGRLDLATTGLLLLTNDTRFAAWLTDPKNKIPRLYVVSVRGCIDASKTKQMMNGIWVEIEDKKQFLIADKVEIQKSSQKESHLLVTLCEGKNREIRRMFLNLGHEVTKLKRIQYGPLKLENLDLGRHREVSQEELIKYFPAYFRK